MLAFLARPGRTAGLTLALAVCAFPASAAPQDRVYTVDDMLQREAIGAVSFDPGETRLVYERQGGYERSTRFDLGRFNTWTTSVLWTVSLHDETSIPRRLLAEAEGEGHVLGPWSPTGRRLLVYRLRDDRFQPGVVDVASGRVRWFDLTAELGVFGRAAQWLTDETVVLLVRPDGSLPWHLRTDRDARTGAAARWEAAAGGRRVTRMTLGSGAFLGENPREPANALVRLSADEGRVETLAEGWLQDFELSPDGRRVAAIETGPPLPVDSDAPLLPGNRPMRRSLRLVDLATGIGEQACGCDPAAGLLAWSEDGRLLVWARGDVSAPTDGALVAIDPSSGRTERFAAPGLIPEVSATATVDFNTVQAAWVSGRPVLFARSRIDGRLDWHRLDPEGPRNLTAALPASPSRIGAIDGDALLVVADGAGWRIGPGGATRLGGRASSILYTPYDAWDPLRLRLNAPPDRDWIVLAGPDGTPQWSGDDAAPTGGAAPAVGTQIRIAAAGRSWAASLLTLNGAEALVVGRRRGQPRVVARLNDHLASVVFAAPIAIPHEAPDGRTVTSWLYRPTSTGDGRLPLVVLAYPGGSGRPQREPWAFGGQTNLQLLVAAGYAVLVPTLPRERYPQEPAAGLTDQILSATDAALTQDPGLDRDRIAYWGQSFGGYAGLVAATETDRFRTFVVSAAVSDLATAWGQFSPTNQDAPRDGLSIRQRAGWVERSQGAMGAPPWSDPQRYVRNSPLFHAGGVNAPVMLIQGDRDLGAISQSQMMFSALWRQNKDAQLLTYGGEDHAFYSPANIRDLQTQILLWLRQTMAAPEPGGRSGPPSTSPRPPDWPG